MIGSLSDGEMRGLLGDVRLAQQDFLWRCLLHAMLDELGVNSHRAAFNISFSKSATHKVWFRLKQVVY